MLGLLPYVNWGDVMLIAVGLLVAGLVLLLLGGEGTVRGGSALAKRYNVQPFIIGATVVAFGTSAPELAVTLTAVLRNEPGLALGNVVGSNIANLGLILGLSALITPIVMVKKQAFQELPVFGLVLLALVGFAWDGSVGRIEGIILLAGMAFVLFRTIKISRKDSAASPNPPSGKGKTPSLLPSIVLVLGGLSGLFFGGQLLVEGAVGIAEWWGMPDWVIAVVIVAVGTSMPEVAASVVAAVRGHGEIALGNVIGSNTFNVLLVLGTGSAIRPFSIDTNISFDLIIVTLFTLLPGVLLLLQQRVPRWTGGILLVGYLAYITLKVMVP
jgi:cation:H+ antiporter